MKNRNHLFSVVLLKESTIDQQKNVDDTKIFEESIILIRAKDDFFENNSQEYLISYFNEKIPPLEYENSYGEMVHVSIVFVVDYFEIIDLFEAEDFTEVYSKTFIEKIGATAESIIDKHYNGFIFKE